MSLIKKVMMAASEMVANHEEEVTILEVAGAHIVAGALMAAKKISKRHAALELTNALALATDGDQELINDCLNKSLAAYAMKQAGPSAMLAKGAVHKSGVN